jgi:hypothetical protein
MDKLQLYSTARKVFAPFETENIIRYTQEFSLKSAIENPLLMLLFLFILFMAVVRKSKTILLTLFATIALMFLMHYTLPANSGGELSLGSTIPFAFGALAIGAALIYFMFIKGE